MHDAQSVIVAALNAINAAFFAIDGAFDAGSSVDLAIRCRFERQR